MARVAVLILFTIVAVVWLTYSVAAKPDNSRQPALEIQCPEFTIIAAPSDKRITVAMAHKMADVLGEEREMVCTVGSIILHRNKGETQ